MRGALKSAMQPGSSSEPGNSRSGTWRTPIEERLSRAESKLAPNRRRLIHEILANSEDTCFLTSRKLAKRYNVDPGTVIRTIQALGYRKYEEFITDLRSHFIVRITPYAVMKAAAREPRSIADHVQHSLETDAHNVQELRSSLDAKRAVGLARRLAKTRRILVVGVDLAAPLAGLLSYALASIGYDAEAPMGSTGNLRQKVNLLGPKDLLIGISFSRCLRETVNAVFRARELGVPTFGITDSDASPIARYCDEFWITSIASPAFSGSYVGPVAAMNALLVACAHVRRRRTLLLLKQKNEELQSGTRWYPLDDHDLHENDGNSADGSYRCRLSRYSPGGLT